METRLEQALNAEQAVLGSILIDPRSYDRVSQILKPGMFQFESNRQIFIAAGELEADGQVIDPVLVKRQLQRDGNPVDNGTLLQLMEVTPTSANDVIYAEAVRDNWRRRELNQIAQAALENSTSTTDELISVALDSIQNLTREATSKNAMTSEDMGVLLLDRLADRANGRQNVVSSGFEKLDDALGGGFLFGSLNIIAARPGMGKTSLALNLADNITRNGEKVLFISLEMPAEQIQAKRIARFSGIPYSRILTGSDINEDEWKRIADANAALSQVKFYLNRPPRMTIQEISATARGIEGLSAIILDYIGLIRGDQNEAEYDRITRISADLKQLALSLDVPVVCLSQLSRACESRQDKRPMLSDLRSSGAIEQDADTVLLLYRGDYYKDNGDESKNPWTPSIVEVDLAKNRHGNTKTVYFNAYLATNRFTEIETRS